MKRVLLQSLIIIFLLTSPVSVHAQRPRRNRVASEQDAHGSYESRMRLYRELTGKESLLKKELDEARSLFSSDAPGKEVLGKKIVELENSLFSLRAELDSLRELIGPINIQGMETPYVNDDSGTRKAMIVENPYFYENLPGNAYSSLLEAQGNEPKVNRLLGSLKENYDQLALLIPVYYLAEKGPQADSVFSRIDRLAEANEELADSIGLLWSNIFETKIYAYNYILDKCGENEMLEEQERQMNNLLLLQSEIEGEYMYEEVAQFALQKLLITRYEQRMADIAGLREAGDSLSNLLPITSRIEDYFLPILDTRERMFYDFADVATARPAKYSSANPIPQVEVFQRGDMYRILLGAYSKSQPVAVFRGVYPLSHEVKGDRKHYYYAGGYRTHSEAQDAVARLKKIGFRNPRIVVWHDGRYSEDPGKGGYSGAVNTKTPENRVHYVVEINGAGDNLSRVVRDVIATQAAGKEISRSSDPASGHSIFVVGTFNTQALAESLVNEIQAVEPTLSAIVVTIP